MRLQLHSFRLTKAVPLAISRGTTAAIATSPNSSSGARTIAPRAR